MSQRGLNPDQKLRKSHLQWVRLGDCTVSSAAQREFRRAHAESIAANFELEALGFITVSFRDDKYYIIDGQHRLRAALLFGFGEDDKFQMEVYTGLTEAEEAEEFLKRNTVKPNSAWDKFHVGVTAGRAEEMAIDHCVRANGLAVAAYRGTNTVSAVGALRHVFTRGGPELLGRVLRIISAAYGSRGLDSAVIEGLGLCLHRYSGQVVEAEMVRRLQAAPGGLNAVMLPAQKLKARLGQPMPQCVAAAIAEVYNRGRGGGKLAPWWKE